MADRTDIDALLISALYGELTPAEEARLTAHLESHPADRTALADLRETRAALRESRLFAVQLEPPQSISAMLVQEAARRAPRKESEGWFQRFLRSFMAHPAMAAAAMLVLVVGVAGTVYVRNGDHLAQPSVSSESYERAMVKAEALPSTAAAPAAPESAAPEPTAGDPAAAAAGELSPPADPKGAGSAAGDTGYLVRLQESEKQGKLRQVAAEGEGTADRRDAGKDLAGERAFEAKVASGAKADGAGQGELPAKLAKKSAAPGSIELRKPAPEPMDLEDKPQRAKRASAELDASPPMSLSDKAARAAEPTPAPARNSVPIGGAAAPAPVVIPQEEAPASPKFAAPVAKTAPATVKTKGPAKPSAQPVSKQEAAPPPPPAPSAAAELARDEAEQAPRSRGQESVVETTSGAAADDDEAQVDPLTAWARKQHAQVRALAAANRCRDAANAATAIYSRAPGYYAQNVANDPRVRSCVSELNAMRETELRKRAKRAPAADTAAPAKPASKK